MRPPAVLVKVPTKSAFHLIIVYGLFTETYAYNSATEGFTRLATGSFPNWEQRRIFMRHNSPGSIKYQNRKAKKQGLFK